MKKIILIIVLILCSLWFYNENNMLEVNEIKLYDNIPLNFDGYRIAQLSDFHNTTIGKENDELIKQLKESNPNIIVITGDFIDSRNTNIDKAISLITKIKDIAPIYYVTGNHESRVQVEYDLLEKTLLDLGVHILRNNSESIIINHDEIHIAGMDDPTMIENLEEFKLDLVNLKKENTYTILLSHRPEYFELYVEAGYSLVFSGHAHGGQIRLPIIGGMIAPGQGLFPKYDAGLYSEKNTNMIVSRGIGNSIFPIRINNHPEIIIVELKKK